MQILKPFDFDGFRRYESMMRDEGREGSPREDGAVGKAEAVSV